MKIGILTRNENSWCSAQLKDSFLKRDVTLICFRFQDLVARVGFKPEFSLDEIDVLTDLSAIIVRPIGRGSLEEIIFRMDLLHRLQRLGMYILNHPSAIERAVDKYYALSLLEENGLPVPRTIVAESADAALSAFADLGGDVVVKPIFGSRGIGSTRISDIDVAERIFRALDFNHQVLYVQEFIPHGDYDLRLLVLGRRVLASMKRVAASWKTNISLGAKPVYYNPPHEIKEMAVNAAETLGCELAGVDILQTKKGPLVIEVNSQPGWKGLQTVTEINIADEIAEYVLAKVKKD
ncbi:RimK family alpha-L-glutamate ligase [Candidatus Bathyarchaeota archaeon]|nr:MAG: RimK family alpha-L-glutamate ligase [Candidatus Bathyarchaeota archaeon]